MTDKPTLTIDNPANENDEPAENVLGGVLAVCGTDPMTGFFRLLRNY